jgi:hypothetical protein
VKLGHGLSILRGVGARALLSRAIYEAAARSGYYGWRFRPYLDLAPDPARVYARFRPRFLPALDRQRLGALYASHPELREALLAAAGQVVSGKIDAYDRSLDLASATFNTDPQTGRPWPTGIHGATYPIRQEGLGDAKYVWEANNFHFAPLLAQAAVLTDDEGYYRGFKSLVARWIDENPGQATVNWNSNLEIGLRLFFWCQAWELFHQAPSFPRWSDDDFGEEGFYLKLSRSLHAQLRFMLTHLWFSAACVKLDHIIGDLLTMVYVLLCYPDLPEASQLESLSARLEREFRTQFSPDGTYAMDSLNYQRYATEFLLAYLQIRPDLPARRREPLAGIARRSVRFLSEFSDDQAGSVRFGENDSARLLRVGGASQNDFGPLFLWAHALVGERLSKDYPPSALEAVAWLNHFPTPPQSRNGTRTSFFPAGGYWRYRDDRVSLWVRTGRNPPLPLGQADQLSFSLSLEGREVVIEPGSGLYNGPEQVRSYFRGALSHSCLRVDGGEPMSAFGRFRWVRPARAWGKEAAAGEGWRLFIARHDGFESLGITWRRLFLVLQDSGVAVVDCLGGRGTHRVERGLHLSSLAAGVEVAGVEDFSLSQENFGVSPSYGRMEQSRLLVERLERRLPWTALLYIGLPDRKAFVSNDGRQARLEVGGGRFGFRLEETLPAFSFGESEEILVSEGPLPEKPPAAS